MKKYVLDVLFLPEKDEVSFSAYQNHRDSGEKRSFLLKKEEEK